MKRLLVLALAAFIAAPLLQAAPKVEAIIAKDQDSKPATSFSADVPKLYAFFRSTGTKQGDTVRAVWIADDVGDAAPKNTKIDEGALTADKDNFFGAFSLSKPTKGWPVGKYHVDIYTGDQLATSVKFSIGAKDEDDDESSD